MAPVNSVVFLQCGIIGFSIEGWRMAESKHRPSFAYNVRHAFEIVKSDDHILCGLGE